jgi:hypothetical protein
VYIGVACGIAAGKVGSKGPADAGGSVGAGGAGIVGVAARVAAAGGTIGDAGGRADGGIVVFGLEPESSNTERRAVT